MASDITLSSAVRSNLLALQNTADLLGKTQERLATGLKVNSALDDPIAFFTSSGLNSRANDLSRLQDFVGNAVQTLKAADEGISAITKLVESAEATARQALQSAGKTASFVGETDIASPTGDAVVTGNLDIDSETDIGANIAGIADDDAFTVAVGNDAPVTITIADGDGTTELLAKLNAVDGLTASITDDGYLSLTAADGKAITVQEDTNTPAAALGLTTGTTGLAGGIGAVGDDFTVQVGSATAVTIENDGNQESILAQLNAIPNIQASLTDSGYLQIEARNGEDLIVTDGTNSLATAYGFTPGTAEPVENEDRTSFAAQFNELRAQITQLAYDSSFNGINLLDGDDLTVTFNEDSTSSLAIEGVTFNPNGLGISSALNGFQKDSDINAAIADLKGASDTLRAQASKFGSNLSVVETRQDFTKKLINVLETGAANLTLADTNEEGANLLALQTRQQLSSTALSLASQADQNVLQLF